MQDSDLLQTIAEIAVALTGFTGVVAFLGDRAQGEWRAVDLFRLNNLLLSSIAALTFSFVPILVFKLGASEFAAWRWSSGLFAAFLLVALEHSRRAMWRLPEPEQVEIVRPIAAAVVVIQSGVSVLLVTSAVGVAYSGESGPFFLGLVWLLGFSAFQFVRLLLVLR